MIRIPIDLKGDDKKVLILIVLVFVIVFVLYFNFLMRPQLARVADLLSRTGRMMANLKTADSNISKIDSFKKIISDNKEKVEEYEEKLPVEHEIPRLLEDLSNMAKTSNIKILSITPLPAPSVKDASARKRAYYKEIPIRINAKSGYHELGAFLNNLEKADRFMKVIDIDIKANRATPKKHDVDLIICTYVLLGG